MGEPQMDRIKKLYKNCGFTLAELLIVVALASVLAALGAAFINPRGLEGANNDNNAKTIAVAVQGRLASMSGGGLAKTRTMGVSAEGGGEGGYRYVFSYAVQSESVARNPEMDELLPAGAADQSVAEGFFAVGFSSVSGAVGEAFWSGKIFRETTAGYLASLAGDPAGRRAEGVGYCSGDADGGILAAETLPVPAITLSDGENLTLSIYLPKAEDGKASGRLAVRVCLEDAEGLVYGAVKDGAGNTVYPALTPDDTAVYRSYSYGGNAVDQSLHGVVAGEYYKIILNCGGEGNLAYAHLADAGGAPSANPPAGKFSDWAARTKAFAGNTGGHPCGFTAGGPVRVTVTVFCLAEDGGINRACVPRSSSLIFDSRSAADGGTAGA